MSGTGVQSVYNRRTRWGRKRNRHASTGRDAWRLSFPLIEVFFYHRLPRAERVISKALAKASDVKLLKFCGAFELYLAKMV